MFNRWIKRRREKALDELCKITKNRFERVDKEAELAGEWKNAKGNRRKELDSKLKKLFDEGVKSWDKENKLLKRVLREKWAKEQIEQQLNEMNGEELMGLMEGGITLKIFNLEEPKLAISKSKAMLATRALEKVFSGKMSDEEVTSLEEHGPKKLPNKELKLIESGRLYLCDEIGISKFEANCALIYVYQKVREIMSRENYVRGNQKMGDEAQYDFVRLMLDELAKADDDLFENLLDESVREAKILRKKLKYEVLIQPPAETPDGWHLAPPLRLDVLKYFLNEVRRGKKPKIIVLWDVEVDMLMALRIVKQLRALGSELENRVFLFPEVEKLKKMKPLECYVVIDTNATRKQIIIDAVIPPKCSKEKRPAIEEQLKQLGYRRSDKSDEWVKVLQMEKTDVGIPQFKLPEAMKLINCATKETIKTIKELKNLEKCIIVK